jgi:hypothetical protein
MVLIEMDSIILKKIRRRIHVHTLRSMVDCADHGHGCNHRRALRSANSLLVFIEGVLARVESEALLSGIKGAEKMLDAARDFRRKSR